MKKFSLLLLIIQCVVFQIKGDTVIGIHGFLTNWRSLKPIEHVFGPCNLDVCLWDYPSGRRYIEEHAVNLLPILQFYACKNPGRPIHFVAHSTGALILRSALNHPGCPNEAKIGRAVLLAPPNQGSDLGRRFRNFFPISFAMGDKSGWQLLNYTACQMRGIGEFPSTMEVLVIAGTKGNKVFFNEPNDGYISVKETYLNTPFYFKSFPYSHGGMISAPPVLCCMRQFICGWNPEPAFRESGNVLEPE